MTKFRFSNKLFYDCDQFADGHSCQGRRGLRGSYRPTLITTDNRSHLARFAASFSIAVSIVWRQPATAADGCHFSCFNHCLAHVLIVTVLTSKRVQAAGGIVDVSVLPFTMPLRECRLATSSYRRSRPVLHDLQTWLPAGYRLVNSGSRLVKLGFSATLLDETLSRLDLLLCGRVLNQITT